MANKKIQIKDKSGNNLYPAIDLSLSNNIGTLDGSKLSDSTVSSSKLSGAVPIDKGGTGATTSSGARTNLGVYSTSQVDSKFVTLSTSQTISGSKTFTVYTSWSNGNMFASLGAAQLGFSNSSTYQSMYYGLGAIGYFTGSGSAPYYSYSFPAKSGTLALTSDIKPAMVSTTWSALKTLRDGGNLVPGQQYRITDYQCTTIQTNTASAGHQFDIIVTADSTNKLNEVARACLHSGDTYFANNNLEAWQLWYCLDNDATRFDWALIKYIDVNVSAYSNRKYYRAEEFDDLSQPYGYAWYSYRDNYKVYTNTDTPTLETKAYSSMSGDDEKDLNAFSNEEGKGVIYRMIDEFNNDCPYDFKNILFTKTDKYTNAYTFSYTVDSVFKDVSLLGLSKKCYSNRMKERIESGLVLSTQQLNFNVFYSLNSRNFACHSNTFGNSCSNNTIGDSCIYSTFGNYCSGNTFGTVCTCNTFGNYFQNNTFGNNCSYNTFGNNCSSNTFGNSCQYNTFGNSCQGNTFGNSCSDNRFGDSFGSSYDGNTFGNSCSNNRFGTSCSNNIFGNYFQNNMFGNNCRNNKFGDSSSAINYCRYIFIDNGCRYLYINSTDTSESSNNYLQNVHVHLGVAGSSNSSRKTITIPDRNLQYTTDVYPIGSTEMFI